MATQLRRIGFLRVLVLALAAGVVVGVAVADDPPGGWPDPGLMGGVKETWKTSSTCKLKSGNCANQPTYCDPVAVTCYSTEYPARKLVNERGYGECGPSVGAVYCTYWTLSPCVRLRVYSHTACLVSTDCYQYLWYENLCYEADNGGTSG